MQIYISVNSVHTQLPQTHRLPLELLPADEDVADAPTVAFADGGDSSPPSALSARLSGDGGGGIAPCCATVEAIEYDGPQLSCSEFCWRSFDCFCSSFCRGGRTECVVI